MRLGLVEFGGGAAALERLTVVMEGGGMVLCFDMLCFLCLGVFGGLKRSSRMGFYGKSLKGQSRECGDKSRLEDWRYGFTRTKSML